MQLVKKLIRNNKGQAVVELALVLPLLLLLIMGMIDFGRVMNAYLIANQASREGARQAAVGKSDTEIIHTVRQTAVSLDSSTLQITVYPQQSERKRGTEAKVSVSCEVEIITPLIGHIISDPYVVECRTSMRVE